jgi:hypothetical protein
MKSAVFNPEILREQLQGSIKIVAFVGFLAAATLFIGLNHKFFVLALGEKSKTYWWMFIIIAVVPLLIIIYAFSYLFGSVPPSST